MTETDVKTGNHDPRLRAEPVEPGLGLPIDRADALLPADLIQGSEIVILLLKPSLWFILLGSLNSLGVLAIVTIIAVWLKWQMQIGPFASADIINFAIVLAFARLLWQFFEWLGRVYVLTDRRVIRVMGVLRVHVFESPLKKLQHTELLFSIRERLFGLGTISLATAGSGAPEAYWVMVNQPLTVHHKLIQAISRCR